MENNFSISRKTKLISIFLILLGYSCAVKPDYNKIIDDNWVELVDPKLSNWDNYLSFKHENGYNGKAPLDSFGNEIKPIGLNQPGFKVFSTFIENNETVIKVSGEYYGCLISKKEYENYHLQLKFKWGNKKWEPRMDKMKDSGILYHSIGDFGAEYWRSWMMSQEFQIMEAHTGDYWSQATSAIDIRAFKSESGLNPMASQNQDYLSFGEKDKSGNYCLRSNNYENEQGEWNTLDLICFNGKSLHIVNGKVVMILKNSRYLNDKGEFVPLNKGKIQLQSEAAEVYFKSVKIKPIENLSADYLNYF